MAAKQAARQALMRIASRMRTGRLTAVFPDGKPRYYGRKGSEPAVTIRINDDEFFRRVFVHGEIGFGEAYMDGLWDADDLVALLELGILNRREIKFDSIIVSAPSRLRNLRLHRSHRNTRKRAQENIHAHYDLSNNFFRLWLDDTLTYSCAYFTHPDEPLAEAQRNKYRRLAEQAGLRAGDRVLEIGSGWGGFAMFAAETYGCHVTSITISQEQYALARQRVSEAGLRDHVSIEYQDYRSIRERYDRIVSIEMFEAVGAEYFATFFDVCDRALRPGGRLALQTISVPDRSYNGLRDGVNWFQKYIFPGGMLPSLAEIERSLADTRFVIDAVDDIGPHYAITLRRWREAFLGRLPEVRALGFDDRFIRMWEYYLAASEAGFLTRNTGDLQIALSKPAGRAAPAWPSAAGREPIAAGI
jgi:cyclopropane-fatty-acyl-phospholipid synthase